MLHGDGASDHEYNNDFVAKHLEPNIFVEGLLHFLSILYYDKLWHSILHTQSIEKYYKSGSKKKLSRYIRISKDGIPA